MKTNKKTLKSLNAVELKKVVGGALCSNEVLFRAAPKQTSSFCDDMTIAD